jgi:hypothetical protein
MGRQQEQADVWGRSDAGPVMRACLEAPFTRKRRASPGPLQAWERRNSRLLGLTINVSPEPRMTQLSTPTRIGLAAGLVCAAGLAQAGDFNAIGVLNQAEFLAFSKDVSAAVSHKAMIPSEGLGITGFDIGLAANATEVASRDILRKAASGASVPKYLPTASLRAVKGLPFDIDIGLTLATVPGTNVRATGGELRWAFIGGGTVLPAVAVRVATMKLDGVDQLKLSNTSIDLSISKGFTFLTPYAGIGTVKTKSSAPGTSLASESFNQSKAFVGLNMALGFGALVLEADKTGDSAGFGVKLAARF